MKIDVGMYVRTSDGQIAKNYKEFYEPSVDVGIGIMEEVNGIWVDNKCINYIDKKYIVKASYNIIDLIEVGDYVNNDIVIVTYEKDEFSDGVLAHVVTRTGKHIFEDDIKSIVTREQMKSMSYEVN